MTNARWRWHSQGLTVTHDPGRGMCYGWLRLGALSGPTSDTGCISRPSRESFFAVSASLGHPLGSLWGALFETFLLPGGPRTRKWMPFRMICFRMFFYTSFYGFRGRPGCQNHGFRMGRVAKITLSPEFDLSSFWLPFGFRFGAENAHKIVSWLTLEALVNTKATKVCDENFTAIFKRPFYEKVTQGSPTRSPKGGPAAGGLLSGE